MNKNLVIALVIGLTMGVGGTLGVKAADKSDANQVVMSTTEHNQMMTDKLRNLRGDDFDKAFIEEMIMHHQGAIDMAVFTQTNAKHTEVKQLGKDIMSAQSKEIDMMQTWQGDWGYKSVPRSHDMQSM